jgi:isochorismate hydrolase
MSWFHENIEREGGAEVHHFHHSRHGLIRESDSLLVIIDMQERLFPVMAEKELLVGNVLKLSRFSKIMRLPVLMTEQEKLGATLPQIREELRDVEPVSKVEFDCFGSHTFVERLKGMNRRTLILSGIEAHICVAQTAISALSDYTVHVVSDAVSSRSVHDREVALDRMTQAGVTLTSTEMVIYEILKRAGTDIFREVLKLVK